jgi:predicted nucleic acid-binding protein
MYLLDTCVLSEFFKQQPDQNVVDWVDSESETSQWISSLTVAELKKGITRLAPSRRKTELERWFGKTMIRFESRVINFDTAIAYRWAAMIASLESKGRRMPVIDSLIAATALEHNLTIVTRNEADFADTGASVLNIWQ